MSDQDQNQTQTPKKSSASLWAVLLVALVGGTGAYYMTQNPAVTQTAIAEEVVTPVVEQEAVVEAVEAVVEAVEAAEEAVAVEADQEPAEAVGEAVPAEAAVEDVRDVTVEAPQISEQQEIVVDLDTGPSFEELAAKCEYPSLTGRVVSEDELKLLGDTVRIYDGGEGVPVGAAVKGRINVEMSGKIVMRVWCDDEHAENLVTEALTDAVNEESREPEQAETDASEETVSEE